MKILNRISIITLSALCTLSTLHTSAFADNASDTLDIRVNTIKNSYIAQHPGYESQINTIIEDVVSSEQFMQYYLYDEIEALHIIEDTIQDAFLPTTSELSLYGLRAGNPSTGIFYAPYNVTAVKQSQNNYCGPASIVQAMIGNGKFDYITDLEEQEQKQGEVAEELTFIQGGGGVLIGSMRDYLNTYYEQETYKYKVKAFTCYTYYHAQRYVYESLRLDACPIYLVDDTAHFDYYNNATFQHYVTISYYNGQMQIMNILDPHYDDLYYGLHTITFDEFDFSASYDGWIIARTTDVSDDKYIYS